MYGHAGWDSGGSAHINHIDMLVGNYRGASAQNLCIDLLTELMNSCW